MTWAILTTEVEQGLHGVAGDLELAASRPGLVEGALGDRVADGAGLLDDGDLAIGLDPACLLHDGVAVEEFEVGEMTTHRLDERQIGLIDPETPIAGPMSS